MASSGNLIQLQAISHTFQGFECPSCMFSILQNMTGWTIFVTLHSVTGGGVCCLPLQEAAGWGCQMRPWQGPPTHPPNWCATCCQSFSPGKTLACSSAFRSHTNPPLDREIVSACMHKFIMMVVLALSSNYTRVAFKIQFLLLLVPNRVCAVISPSFKERPCWCVDRMLLQKNGKLFNACFFYLHHFQGNSACLLLLTPHFPC